MKGKIKIGILGLGNMGSAIAARFADKGHELYAFDKDKTRLQDIGCIKVTDTLPELLSSTEITILAIKPQDFGTVLREIKENKDLDNKIIVSIAAGVTTAIIEEVLGSVRVIRVMPNLFAASGDGVCGICKGKYATEEDLSTIQSLLECLGKVIVVTEDKMDEITAVSGSGPGYLCYLVKDDAPSKRIEHLDRIIPFYEKKVAIECGFSQDEIKIVATDTANTLKKYLTEHPDETPKDFCDKVTSKGGTTEAAIDVLKNKGESALGEAIKAAKERAKELAKEIQDKIKEGEK